MFVGFAMTLRFIKNYITPINYKKMYSQNPNIMKKGTEQGTGTERHRNGKARERKGTGTERHGNGTTQGSFPTNLYISARHEGRSQ